MKSVEEIINIAYERADKRLSQISKSRIKYCKRVRNREKLRERRKSK